jgi:hypothetical protein
VHAGGLTAACLASFFFHASFFQALDETREKFEMGSGESLYYHALAKQAQNMTLPGKAAALPGC